MNIKITYQWLLDYLDTDADPYEIQKYLSLCGPSIESVEKVGSDFVFDIEITTNRIDSASVFGIAQEAQAILPQFGKKAEIKFNPLEKLSFADVDEGSEPMIDVEIKEKELVNRISLIVLSGVNIKPSAEKIKSRLSACGIKTINNVVDISNYIRISLGQPCHIFDYDAIAGHKMIVRKSKKGEMIQTLDKDKVILPGKDIVISDKDGKLIDQPGIMGAFNSSVKSTTKNIILFIPIFNGKMVRRTSMLTGKRSDSASYFEKGLDEERTTPALVFGIDLLKEHAGATVASKITDIYESTFKPKKVTVSFSDINKLVGVEIDKQKVKDILVRLGFGIDNKDDELDISVTSFRKNDIDSKQDIIEEVARIYGYHNIPSRLQNMAYVEPQKDIENIIIKTEETKKYLKHIGLNEVINYSMISKDQIINFEEKDDDYLKISNPLSQDLLYLRKSLMPSLISNIKSNQGKQKNMKFFEISKVFIKNDKKLPEEDLMLSIVTNKSYFDLKGIVETILQNLFISKYEFTKSNEIYFANDKQTNLMINGKNIGSLGLIKNSIVQKFGLTTQVYLAEFNFTDLIENARFLPEYKQITQYAVIKLDLTTTTDNYESFKEKAYLASNLLVDISLLSRFEDKNTFRLFFSSFERNITEKEALEELEKIKTKS
jgi:phenylalanyl-tRNA synthetase beta chain